MSKEIIVKLTPEAAQMVVEHLEGANLRRQQCYVGQLILNQIKEQRTPVWEVQSTCRVCTFIGYRDDPLKAQVIEVGEERRSTIVIVTSWPVYPEIGLIGTFGGVRFFQGHDSGCVDTSTIWLPSKGRDGLTARLHGSYVEKFVSSFEAFLQHLKEEKRDAVDNTQDKEGE